MHAIDELESCIWQKIQTATQQRDTARLSMFNSLAAKLESIQQDIFTIEQVLVDNTVFDTSYSSNHAFPPEGAELRFLYKTGNIPVS